MEKQHLAKLLDHLVCAEGACRGLRQEAQFFQQSKLEPEVPLYLVEVWYSEVQGSSCQEKLLGEQWLNLDALDCRGNSSCSICLAPRLPFSRPAVGKCNFGDRQHREHIRLMGQGFCLKFVGVQSRSPQHVLLRNLELSLRPQDDDLESHTAISLQTLRLRIWLWGFDGTSCCDDEQRCINAVPTKPSSNKQCRYGGGDRLYEATERRGDEENVSIHCAGCLATSLHSSESELYSTDFGSKVFPSVDTADARWGCIHFSSGYLQEQVDHMKFSLKLQAVDDRQQAARWHPANAVEALLPWPRALCGLKAETSSELRARNDAVLLEKLKSSRDCLSAEADYLRVELRRYQEETKDCLKKKVEETRRLNQEKQNRINEERKKYIDGERRQMVNGRRWLAIVQRALVIGRWFSIVKGARALCSWSKLVTECWWHSKHSLSVLSWTKATRLNCGGIGNHLRFLMVLCERQGLLYEDEDGFFQIHIVSMRRLEETELGVELRVRLEVSSATKATSHVSSTQRRYADKSRTSRTALSLRHSKTDLDPREDQVAGVHSIQVVKCENDVYCRQKNFTRKHHKQLEQIDLYFEPVEFPSGNPIVMGVEAMIAGVGLRACETRLPVGITTFLMPLSAIDFKSTWSDLEHNGFTCRRYGFPIPLGIDLHQLPIIPKYRQALECGKAFQIFPLDNLSLGLAAEFPPHGYIDDCHRVLVSMVQQLPDVPNAALHEESSRKGDKHSRLTLSIEVRASHKRLAKAVKATLETVLMQLHHLTG